ncbi:hypothetical protein NUW54_g12436 [Trametes sanguinea]|uniref:Uncharacterized protein n=1 Tax=Trametes sanguinea TaxID=158606 RepID=A0ACC1MZP5_9APHY|nr:hypothetical protein NUW54_g12436 [Trametes sanguinea]
MPGTPHAPNEALADHGGLRSKPRLHRTEQTSTTRTELWPIAGVLRPMKRHCVWARPYLRADPRLGMNEGSAISLDTLALDEQRLGREAAVRSMPNLAIIHDLSGESVAGDMLTCETSGLFDGDGEAIGGYRYAGALRGRERRRVISTPWKIRREAEGRIEELTFAKLTPLSRAAKYLKSWTEAGSGVQGFPSAFAHG